MKLTLPNLNQLSPHRNLRELAVRWRQASRRKRLLTAVCVLAVWVVIGAGIWWILTNNNQQATENRQPLPTPDQFVAEGKAFLDQASLEPDDEILPLVYLAQAYEKTTQYDRFLAELNTIEQTHPEAAKNNYIFLISLFNAHRNLGDEAAAKKVAKQITDLEQKGERVNPLKDEPIMKTVRNYAK